MEMIKINCCKCNCRLNHLQLRQIIYDKEHDRDIYEIECFNPNCREFNYLSRDGYFVLKHEVCAIAKSVPKLNMKTPAEKKILMISMERSGSSWVAAHISIEHMKIYGTLPKWNHECDRRYAVFKKVQTKEGLVEIVTPKGWTSVYDINPLEALEKDFDKIILLQKDRESLKDDICKYNHSDKWRQEKITGDKDEFLTRLRKVIDKWWDIMFSQEFDDPRIYKVNLEDLNHFTEFEFPKLYDFLDFPERTRCHTYAVNRDWQVFSDILPPGTIPSARLRQLQKMGNEMAKEMLQEDLFFLKLRDEGKWTDVTKYPFVNDINPYVHIPHEPELIEPRSYRLAEPNIKDVLELSVGERGIQPEKKQSKKKSRKEKKRKKRMINI